MRLLAHLAVNLLFSFCGVQGFAPINNLIPTFHSRKSLVDRTQIRLASAEVSTETKAAGKTAGPAKKKQKLGLITFDLDDTLYPIEPVISDANEAFSAAMKSFGYENIAPIDIIRTAKKIRAEADPDAPLMTHKEVRLKAVRRELEEMILERKLVETALDWATDVKHLGKMVVDSAKKWSKSAVSSNVVQAVYNSWEMERYHSAERNLYPEVLDVLKQLKDENPGVIIGAVTDGSANPMMMVHTLAPYFDFCVSWEDDNVSLAKSALARYKELSAVEGSDDLAWIYDVALKKYKELASAAAGMKEKGEEDEDAIWIHVGDDLAYDVGGAATCGAKTILVELSDDYKQTARQRYDGAQPAWATKPIEAMKERKAIAEAAKENINAKVKRLSYIPEAITKILNEGSMAV